MSSAPRRHALVVGVISSAALALGAWAGLHFCRSNSQAAVSLAALRTVAALLEDDQSLLSELGAASGANEDTAILPAYLLKLRSEGLPKSAAMKQRLDRLAENNAAILALVKTLAPHARTATFASESDKFVHYAIAWRDRWNSAMELYVAGGSFALTGVPFPTGFAAAVREEIAATR